MIIDKSNVSAGWLPSLIFVFARIMTFWTEFLKETSKTLRFGLACGIFLVAVFCLIYWLSENRILVRLGRVACPSCGQSFGFSADRDAKRRYKQKCEREYDDIIGKHGGDALVDFNHRWEVECPHCHQITIFDSLRVRLENVA